MQCFEFYIMLNQDYQEALSTILRCNSQGKASGTWQIMENGAEGDTGGPTVLAITLGKGAEIRTNSEARCSAETIRV